MTHVLTENHYTWLRTGLNAVKPHIRFVYLNDTADGCIRVLAMGKTCKDHRYKKDHAKVTTISADGTNSTNLFDIEEIREVLAEWDAWQEELNTNHPNNHETGLSLVK